jgi:hypothetical protein
VSAPSRVRDGPRGTLPLVGRNGSVSPGNLFIFFFHFSFPFLYFQTQFDLIPTCCESSFIISTFAIKNTKTEDNYLYILFIFTYLFSFPYFPKP